MTGRRQPGRPWQRALALSVGIAVALGVSAAHVPGPWHQDEASHECPICKLGCQPVPLAPTSAMVEPPAPPRIFAVPPEQPGRLLQAEGHSPSRAPPA